MSSEVVVNVSMRVFEQVMEIVEEADVPEEYIRECGRVTDVEDP